MTFYEMMMAVVISEYFQTIFNAKGYRSLSLLLLDPFWHSILNPNGKWIRNPLKALFSIRIQNAKC